MRILGYFFFNLLQISLIFYHFSKNNYIFERAFEKKVLPLHGKFLKHVRIWN